MENITRSSAVYTSNKNVKSTEEPNQKKDTSCTEDLEFAILEIEACTKRRA